VVGGKGSIQPGAAFGGGGAYTENTNSGGGGGLSGVFTADPSPWSASFQNQALLIAGGGGGGSEAGSGGAGSGPGRGADVGWPATLTCRQSHGYNMQGGATATTGGNGVVGTDGSALQGGSRPDSGCNCQRSPGGGGGGGGYFGGGGGGNMGYCYYGGGGGAGYARPLNFDNVNCGIEGSGGSGGGSPKNTDGSVTITVVCP
jgi:hypothetical protein